MVYIIIILDLPTPDEYKLMISRLKRISDTYKNGVYAIEKNENDAENDGKDEFSIKVGGIEELLQQTKINSEKNPKYDPTKKRIIREEDEDGIVTRTPNFQDKASQDFLETLHKFRKDIKKAGEFDKSLLKDFSQERNEKITKYMNDREKELDEQFNRKKDKNKHNKDKNQKKKRFGKKK